MKNPYLNLNDRAFWRRSVVAPGAENVDPVSTPPFAIGKRETVATAGSCFAQHIAHFLKNNGYSYFISEPGDLDKNYGVFSARYGNLYTVRQLLQLFQRAYGLFSPAEKSWVLPTGNVIDPFRPQVEPDGFATEEDLVIDREKHLSAVQKMFEECSVFVFTLGLTEGWVSRRDGAVFPLAPGVVGDTNGTTKDDYHFHNFTVAEVTEDLKLFIFMLRSVNPDVKIVLTVSPVPLVATYANQHVLTSTVYSKSVLRVAAEEISRLIPEVAYFPSYEVITGNHTRYMYFEDDLRSVSSIGVARAMSLFSKHYLSVENNATKSVSGQPAISPATKPTQTPPSGRSYLYDVICDEEELDK